MSRLLIMLALVLAFAVPAAAQDEYCPGAPEPRLTYGVEARVLPGAPNRLRAEPNTSAEILAEIQPGEMVFVGSGPVCAENYVWWYVNYNGVVGWTVEGSGDEYYLEAAINIVSEIGDVETTVDFEGVHFSFPNTLGGDTALLNVGGVVVPREEPTADGPYWQGHPQFVEFRFDPYAPENVQQNAYIRVFPAQEYAGMNEFVAEQVSALQTLLDSSDPIPADEPLPFLPVFNAAQVFRAQVERLEFGNGSGIRFLTSFAQDVYPVTNERLVYTFQGLTEDGEYYVSAIFPLSAAALPDTVEPDFDFDAFVAGYEDYIADLVTALNSEASDSFTPDLTTLDTAIQSLQVEPSLD